MSASYYLACQKCKSYVWVGQSQNSNPPFCFYSGEPTTMHNLRVFLWTHKGHALEMEDSQVLVEEGILVEDEHGYILGEAKTGGRG